MKKKSNAKRAVLVATAILCSVVLIVLGGVALYLNDMLDRLVGNDTSGNTVFTGIDPGTTGSTSASSSVETIPAPEEVINIMLLGQDDDEGAEYGRTDAMVLCSINPKTKKITMVSFMRDLWVTIPGKWDQRINTAYRYGGFDLLKETIQYNFGIEVDDFILVEFDTFKIVVDKLGGVEIDLSQDEATWLNNHYWFNEWMLTAGVNRLDGEMALAYSRIRYLDSDFYRVQRQHKVLSSVFQTYKNKPIMELLNVTNELLPYLTVTMDKSDIIHYMMSMAPMISGLTIETHRIPADGTWWYDRIDNNEIIAADLQENRDLLAEWIKP